jgi:von Willebrand factor type A domain-containing protein
MSRKLVGLCKFVAAVLPLGLIPALGSCSDDEGGAQASGGAGSAGFSGSGVGGITVGAGGGAGSSGVGGSGGTFIVTNDGGTCTIGDNGMGCTGQAYAGEVVPLDIYIMFDQSGSMCACIDPPKTNNPCPDPTCNKTRLQAIREAAAQFLNDERSAGIGVGISYFGFNPIGSASCNVADYSNAAVPVGMLPDHANAIMQSLNGIQPTGETPSAAAVRGACSYASQWKASQAGHEVVILLLTDGRPEAPVTCRSGTCCPTLEDTVAAAAECANGDQRIKTYVLGVGPFLQNLEQIAQAGGTSHAYLVEGNDVSNQVLDALRAIRGDAQIPCDLSLPPAPNGQGLDFTKVNIVYANSACEPTYFYHVETADGCTDQGGWFYDNPAAPQKIHLCPTSCDQVTNPGGQLVYTVGCNSITPPPQ